MKKLQQYAIINPKSERRDYASFDARVPLDSIRIGTVLRMPVNVIADSGRTDGQRITADCKIIRIYWDKQLILVSFRCGNVVMRETYKFVIEEGGGADG